MPVKKFYYCRVCGKKMIERMPNGLWKFVFGSDREQMREPPVEIMIYGSVKMRCIRKTCRKWNTFHFFPHPHIFNPSIDEEEESISETEALANTN